MSTPWPRFYAVRQRFDATEIADVGAAARAALDASGARVPPGGRVAITAGSRGIDRIPEVLRATVEWVRASGAEPFVLAAMGSHGGATEDGQLAVLSGYGITQESLGCPVRACVESIPVVTTPAGDPVLCNRLACAADGVVVVNRVKPHTILTGAQGSGLMKMLAIGLGGPRGADGLHARGLVAGMLPTARVLRDHLPVVCGLAVLENAFDRVCAVDAALPGQFEETDSRLLARARRLLPHIPFDPLDLLVVRRMGKNLSGAGMDPNVIGMHRRLGGAPDREIGRIVALDLTAESHGNAIGVGMADLITERLRAKIDWEATTTNGLTSGFFAGIKLPVALPTDRDAIAAGLKGFAPEHARVALIADTAHLERLIVSEPLWVEAQGREDLIPGDAPLPLSFDADGNLSLSD